MSETMSREQLMARVASIICDQTCGLSSECKSREAAQALFEQGYLAAPSPDSQMVGICPTCEGTGKEGRHSICRDCDESAPSDQMSDIEALKEPFCVLFLDGRNEHGSHVLPSFPRSFDPVETNIEDQAETILSEAESLGFAVGDHVWAEFVWNGPQIGDEGRVELSGYWEFKRINADMSRAAISAMEGSV